MLVKIYGTLWILLGLVTGIVFLIGLLTAEVLVLLGVALFALIFFGMIGVLPIAMTESNNH